MRAPEQKAPIKKALHVYGLVAARGMRLPMLQGRQGAPVRKVPHGPIAILVSEVDLSRRLGRRDLLEHVHVLEQVVEHQAVLPMRFGVNAESEQELRRHLPNPEIWAAQLQRFSGQFQMSVEATHKEEEAIRELMRRDPKILALRQKGPGELGANAQNVELGEYVFHALEKLRRQDGVALLRGLAPFARGVVDRTSPGKVLSASFLVDRKRHRELDAAVARAAMPRLELRYVGPQPP